jgi:hypothetical protein
MDYKLGRVSYFKFGNFLFNNTLTAFLDEKAMGSATESIGTLSESARAKVE